MQIRIKFNHLTFKNEKIDTIPLLTSKPHHSLETEGRAYES